MSKERSQIYANVPKIANEKQEAFSAKAASLNELMGWFQIQQELIWPKIAICLIATT